MCIARGYNCDTVCFTACLKLRKKKKKKKILFTHTNCKNRRFKEFWCMGRIIVCIERELEGNSRPMVNFFSFCRWTGVRSGRCGTRGNSNDVDTVSEACIGGWGCGTGSVTGSGREASTATEGG